MKLCLHVKTGNRKVINTMCKHSSFAFDLAFDLSKPAGLILASRSRRMGVRRYRHELPVDVKGVSEAALDIYRSRETIALPTHTAVPTGEGD